MKKIISVLLAIILAFSCVVIACAEDELEWEEIKMGGKRGDVNADGKITAVDALMVLKYVAGSEELSEMRGFRFGGASRRVCETCHRRAAYRFIRRFALRGYT